MGSIKLKHTSGNGTIIHSPAANPSSDVTLKLPSTTGSAGQVLKVASANHSATNAELEFGADAGGKVIQFKYAQSTTLVETTSTSYQTYTQLSIDITPTSASNLIFCQLVINANVYEQSGSDAHGQMAVTDDNGSSYLFENEIRFYDYGGSGGFIIPSNSGGFHVETAGTTSAKSYKVRYRLVTGDKIVINNYGTGTDKNRSFFSVMEIEP